MLTAVEQTVFPVPPPPHSAWTKGHMSDHLKALSRSLTNTQSHTHSLSLTLSLTFSASSGASSGARTLCSRPRPWTSASIYGTTGFHCYLSQQRFHFCFEKFHYRLLSRWAALFLNGSREEKGTKTPRAVFDTPSTESSTPHTGLDTPSTVSEAPHKGLDTPITVSDTLHKVLGTPQRVHTYHHSLFFFHQSSQWDQIAFLGFLISTGARRNPATCVVSIRIIEQGTLPLLPCIYTSPLLSERGEVRESRERERVICVCVCVKSPGGQKAVEVLRPELKG